MTALMVEELKVNVIDKKRDKSRSTRNEDQQLLTRPNFYSKQSPPVDRDSRPGRKVDVVKSLLLILEQL